MNIVFRSQKKKVSIHESAKPVPAEKAQFLEPAPEAQEAELNSSNRERQTPAFVEQTAKRSYRKLYDQKAAEEAKLAGSTLTENAALRRQQKEQIHAMEAAHQAQILKTTPNSHFMPLIIIIIIIMIIIIIFLQALKKAQQERVKEVFLTVRALGLVCVLAYVGRPAAPFRRNKRLPKVALILRPLGGRLCHLP